VAAAVVLGNESCWRHRKLVRLQRSLSVLAVLVVLGKQVQRATELLVQVAVLPDLGLCISLAVEMAVLAVLATLTVVAVMSAHLESSWLSTVLSVLVVLVLAQVWVVLAQNRGGALLVVVVVVAVQQLTVLVVMVGPMRQTLVWLLPTHTVRTLAAAVLVVLPTVVLVRLVHRSVSVAAVAAHPTRQQAVLVVQVVLVQAVAVALAQTATIMVAMVVLAVTQKSRSGSSDEMA